MTNSTITQLTHIIRQAAFATGFEQQVQLIVNSICETLGMDVCTLYRQDREHNMVLVASQGLAAGHPFTIPAGQGLVGRVARTGNVFNIINPEQHPEFFYVRDSREEQLHSFCGVPLVHHAKVTGVLVVQRKQAELLSVDDEALLLTLASHLALLLNDLPDPAATAVVEYAQRKGISGAPGLAIGSAFLTRSKQLVTVKHQECSDPKAEKLAWKQLQKDTLKELAAERKLVEAAMGEALASVLDAYKQFLQDPSFAQQIEQLIENHASLPWAIKQTVQHFADQFLAIDDPYLQARHEDIHHLGEKLYQVWSQRRASSGVNDVAGTNAIILCGDNISVSDIVSLPTKKLKGILCSGGAALSHVAVFANALGIPAIMGVGDLPLQSGDRLILDGDNAEVHIKPGKTIVAEYRRLIDERSKFTRELRQHGHEAADTLDGQHVTVMANSGLQADILPGLKNGADGVGLYRTELPFMVHPNLPSEAEQLQVYRRVIEAYDNKPVCFRVLDIGGDKPLPYLPANKEENPALGLRGIRFLLDNKPLFISQLRAIIRAAIGYSGMQVLLPMLTTTDELDQCRVLLADVVEQLKEEGFEVDIPRLGVMVEVPGVVSLLPFWQEKIDFISIGSNDLSQYLLAVDRNNSLVAAQYDPLHPAVIHEIQRIVTTAIRCQLPISLCGEMASDPVSVLLLLGMGIRNFSMSSARIPYIKWLLQNVSVADSEALLVNALQQDNAKSIRQLGEKLLASLAIDTRYYLSH